MKEIETVLLAVGTNLGDRLKNLRDAIQILSSSMCIKRTSHVIETTAVLPESAPPEWNLSYLNMAVEVSTDRSPPELLPVIKEIEKKLGRNPNAPLWSPRIIDIDILRYGNLEISTDLLIIPHRELPKRDFWQFLLNEMGCEIPEEIRLDLSKYAPLNHFVLQPKFMGILNVTPDSFSDGGKFFDPAEAEQQARKLRDDGASIVDIGAQSTHPGYVEIPPREEISRLSAVLERCSDIECISIDTYFDEVVEYVLQKPNVKWINDQNSKLGVNTLKLIADRNIKLVVMMHGMNQLWLEDRLKYLENLGIQKSNIVVDPGIGFGKSKYQNIYLIKNLKSFRQDGCEILLGASRKSFISAYSNADAKDRDIETIAVSCFAADIGVDYLRVHNVKDHMRFFTAKHCIENVA